jgi:hypothetical protein
MGHVQNAALCNDRGLVCAMSSANMQIIRSSFCCLNYMIVTLSAEGNGSGSNLNTLTMVNFHT